jgi:hypothetical protein
MIAGDKVRVVLPDDQPFSQWVGKVREVDTSLPFQVRVFFDGFGFVWFADDELRPA